MKPTIDVAVVQPGEVIIIGNEQAIVVTTRVSNAYNCVALAYQRAINTPVHIAFYAHGERVEYVG